jgi:hypothetical protein
MAFRIMVALALLATTRASAEPLPDRARPALAWDAPAGCPSQDLFGRVAGLVGLGREALAAKLLRVDAQVRQPAEGGFQAHLTVETDVGSGERTFEAEDCRSLLDGAALIVALAVDPAVKVPAVKVKSPPPTSALHASPRFLLRPLLGADLGVLPEAGIVYGLAAGVAWPRVRLELDGTSQPRQEIFNTSGHGGRIRPLLGTGVRACLQPGQPGRFEPAVCAGGRLAWLRSTGLSILQPETHDSLAVMLDLGAALAVRLQDWLWLRAEGLFGLSLRRSRFAIDGREDVYRTRSLAGRLGGGLEFRF